MNEDYLILTHEKELLEKLQKKGFGFYNLASKELKNFHLPKGTSVQVLSLEQDSPKIKYSIPENLYVFIPAKEGQPSSERVFLKLGPKLQISILKDQQREDAFAYVGSKLTFKDQPTSFQLPLKKIRASKKEYPELEGKSDPYELSIRGHRLLIQFNGKYTLFLIITKKGQRYLSYGRSSEITNYSMKFHEWIDGYYSYFTNDGSEGKCLQLFFIGNDDVYQVKLPCILEEWKTEE
jgi:hypothetical protein